MRSPLRPAPLMLLLVPLALGGARAQTAPPSPAAAAPAQSVSAPLTLQGTLARLRQSPGWQGADLQYRAAELALQSARARAGLNVTVGADASAVKVPLSSGDLTLNTTVTAQVSASVLPWSPALEAVRSAERGLSRAGADRRAARLTATVNAVQSYLAARNAAASLALADAQVNLTARQLEVAQSQRQSGVLTAEGLLVRQGAFDDAQAAQEQARTNVDLAARGLANLLGQPVTLPAGATAFGPLPAAPGQPAALEAQITRALATRPEVARAQNDLADAQAQLRAAQLDVRLPDLSASAQYGQLTSSTSTIATRTVGGSLDVKTGVLAGQVSFPLRDPGDLPTGLALTLSADLPVLGGTRRTALTSAEVGVQQATLALDTARQSVDLEVRQRYADLRTALDTLGSQRGALTRARAALATTLGRLTAGLATALDVEAAELNLRQAELNVDIATVNAYLASLRLSQATTDLDPTLLTTPPSTPTAPEARP
ncbi:TolC family protein [Deinococcus aestuarii]|uniref:TolC family protein n=1 Tax=Deinococcus aestuarii TaxID=2774531 RepID=UPI001C0DE014|nr:TolC family protein [Deinococcus aestuarii]